MSEQTSILTRIDERLSQFSERERQLLGAMAATFLVMALFLAGWFFARTTGRIEHSIDQQRGALDAIYEQRERFLAQRAEAEELVERLEDNDLRLSSFIELRATRAGVSAPREFRDRQQPLAGNAGITTFETTAVFPNMSIDQLTELLNQIRSTDELVYIQQVAVKPARRSDPGALEVELTLVTYRRSEEGG